MAFKIKDLEGNLGEIAAQLTALKPMVLVAEEENEWQIWLEPDYLHVLDLGVFVFQGNSLLYNPESLEYEPNFSVTAFYDPDTGKELYYESDVNICICISNYLYETGTSKSIEDISEMKCFYKLDNGVFLNEKVLGGKSR